MLMVGFEPAPSKRGSPSNALDHSTTRKMIGTTQNLLINFNIPFHHHHANTLCYSRQHYTLHNTYYSLTHSIIHSLTHSITHSLTHSINQPHNHSPLTTPCQSIHHCRLPQTTQCNTFTRWVSEGECVSSCLFDTCPLNVSACHPTCWINFTLS